MRVWGFSGLRIQYFQDISAHERPTFTRLRLQIVVGAAAKAAVSSTNVQTWSGTLDDLAELLTPLVAARQTAEGSRALVHRCPLLDGCDASVHCALASNLILHRFEPGDVLIEGGGAPAYEQVHLIADGEVAITHVLLLAAHLGAEPRLKRPGCVHEGHCYPIYAGVEVC